MESYPFPGRTSGSSFAGNPSSPILRGFAWMISAVMHPLLISIYVALFLAYVHPAAFSGIDPRTKMLRMITVFICTAGFPGLTLFLAWRLKLIGSIRLEDRKDRIVGYLVTMFFYWWLWNVFRNLDGTPGSILHFVTGTFLAVCGGWMCNIFFKINMHAIAMGGLAIFALMMTFEDPYASGLYLAIAFLAAGLVCTARLIVSDHSWFQILTGLAVGALAQFIAWVV